MTRTAILVRFLRFGALAFGGPVHQIGMLKRELVDEERWIEPERFRRVLGVYQALPGPEATELSVHFGMLRGGRLGGLLAGLGFMVPGLLLMLGASALYVAAFDGGVGGARPALLVTLSAGAAPAAVVLMARGGWRIANGALRHPLLISGALAAAAADLAGIPFWIGLLMAGALSELRTNRERLVVCIALAALIAAGIATLPWNEPATGGWTGYVPLSGSAEPVLPSLLFLFGVGLRGGLLTFGGAYTSIPFVRALVVGRGGFMSDLVFLDGLAIGSLLPAPLVIFSTFVGYVGAGLPGALVTTLGMFLPAFAFTLLGYGLIERIVEAPRVHAFLDGITAGVVGIVAVTVVRLADAAFNDLRGVLAGFAAAIVVFSWRSAYASIGAIAAAIAVAAAIR